MTLIARYYCRRYCDVRLYRLDFDNVITAPLQLEFRDGDLALQIQ